MRKRPYHVGQIHQSSACQLPRHTAHSDRRNPILPRLWQRPKPSTSPTPTTTTTVHGRSRIWHAQPAYTSHRFGHSQENTRWKQIPYSSKNSRPPKSNIQDRRPSLLQEQNSRQMGPEMAPWIPYHLHRKGRQIHPHWKSSHRKNPLLQRPGHHIGTSSRTLERGHKIWPPSQIRQPPRQPPNHKH